MKKCRKELRDDGRIEYMHTDLAPKFNLNYLELTNRSRYAGPYDLPALSCKTSVLPDSIALYGQPGLYRRTERTAVGFWQYDNEFDGIHGLYNAIYHNDKQLLSRFEKRFEGVRIFFTPDYSQFGDIDFAENLYRIKKQRVVGIWLTMQLGAVAIPFITAPTAQYAPIALQGLEDCRVVAFSTKAYATHPDELAEIRGLVKAAVDALDLRAIVVYDCCGDDSVVDDTFAYARKHGIEVAVPWNSLRERNRLRKGAVR